MNSGCNNRPFYLIPDFYEPEHGDEIVKHFGELSILTGGSSLVSALAKMYAHSHVTVANNFAASHTQGEAIILAGSCSENTLRQITHFKGINGGIA